MATTFKTPGVYVQEIQKLPASVAQVETAIPAFIGYTERQKEVLKDGLKVARVESLLDFEEKFGGPPAESMIVKVDSGSIVGVETKTPSPFKMYHSIRMFFANGGGACYIISVGTYSSKVDTKALEKGLARLEKEDEPTLIISPDAVSLDKGPYQFYIQALEQCNRLQDRFVIMDTLQPDTSGNEEAVIKTFRSGIGTKNLKYGAVYYPWIETTFSPHYTNATITLDNATGSKDQLPKGSLEDLLKGKGSSANKTAESSKDSNSSDLLTSAFLASIKEEIENTTVILPPSASIAGVYASIDRERGVWKAPANISLNAVLGPTVKVTNDLQDRLNVDVTAGKSVNAIRTFFGQGTMVWGARTLAGNDNEWRYINVRRFFNMIEESIKKAISWAVFEPNEPNTWVRVTAMIENYLTGLWRQGALVGATTDQAFYVQVGLGTTMTQVDILEGRMNVEIGLATSRPAEFIILKFSHKLQES